MRSPRQLLLDILDACQVVLDCTPVVESEFDADPYLRSHVYLHILIVGEACARMPQAIKEAHSTVPWRTITDMRNILIHVYFGVNWHRMYETARDDIPLLKAHIEAILASLPPEP